jgi:hypothetical protein
MSAVSTFSTTHGSPDAASRTIVAASIHPVPRSPFALRLRPVTFEWS